MSIFKSLGNRVASWYRGRVDERRENVFMSHNERTWREYVPDRPQREVLVESLDMATGLIALSYMSNLLAREHNARIRAYTTSTKDPMARTLSRRLDRIYESFNAECFFVETNETHFKRGEELFKEIMPTLKTKRDIESMMVEGVLMGDVVYDSFLMKKRVPTIDLKDHDFHEFLKRALSYFVYWKDYFDSHNVKAVIVSHSVYYELATILRLAIYRDIPSYQISANHVYRLSRENLWAYADYKLYPEEFKRLPDDVKQQGLVEAKNRMNGRFEGEVGIDMAYSKKSAYALQNRGRVLRESDRIKVLISTHCFFDAPHGYGLNLFPDLYEWLDFLGRVSMKTDYDWYIKTHPDYLPGTMEIVKGFVAKYPSLTLLPADTSHFQIIEDGIDFNLTVYGTIGCEYAALGIPVINASTCNPHITYDFNIHPMSVEEYERTLMNLKDKKLEINANKVYEYYFMRFIHQPYNWLFSDYDAFLQQIGGHQQQYFPVSYEKFLVELSSEKHERIIRTLTNFINSGEYHMRVEHLG